MFTKTSLHFQTQALFLLVTDYLLPHRILNALCSLPWKFLCLLNFLVVCFYSHSYCPFYYVMITLINTQYCINFLFGLKYNKILRIQKFRGYISHKCFRCAIGENTSFYIYPYLCFSMGLFSYFHIKNGIHCG